MKENLKKTNGITLVTLVITIIVLMILAGVSFLALTNNGIIDHAKNAKEEQIVAQENEVMGLAYSEYKISKMDNEEYTMQEALDNAQAGATAEGDEILGWTITFEETRHQYTIYGDGTINEGIPEKWDGTSKEKPTIAEDNSWHIYNCAQMKYFADFVNGELTEEEKGDLSITEETVVYLEANLDLGARANDDGEKIAGTEWTPIGIDKNNAFIGTFEGNNHYITGAYVNIDGDLGGIFGNSNTIKNLTIINSYIKGVNCIGGIVGALRTGNIENCHNINTIIVGENQSIGGVVGQFTGKTIGNCSNTGNIIGDGKLIGGISGYIYQTSTVSNCYNGGNVSGKGNYVGGICGYAYQTSTILNCHNEGKITGESTVAGGISGYIGKDSTVSNCTNKGKIMVNNESGNITYCGVAGIVGDCRGNIDNCINYETVLAESPNKWNRAGGITGWIGSSDGPECTITNCSNYGDISAKGKETYMALAGGIVGDSTGNYTITNCYNSGNIKGTNANYIYIGGIIGRQGKLSEEKNSLQYCYSKGKVEEESVLQLLRKGGIGGDVYNPESVKSCYYYDVLENNMGALQGKDYEENNVEKTENIFNNIDEFLNWIQQK